MIDLHCHLLPSLDDGSPSLEVSCAMARQAVASGVRQIVCTPHCVTGDRDAAKRIRRLQQTAERLREELVRNQIPLTLSVGMELLCRSSLPETLERGDFLTLAGSRYLLIEFSFQTSLSRIEWVAETVKQRGYFPVLAHPERYHAVWRTPDCLLAWFQAGYVLQLDKDSILGRFGRECARTADWALRHGLSHIVASDAHDAERRTTDLEEVWRFLRRRYQPGYAELLLSRNPGRIVADRPLVMPEEF
ncbi:MAG TPA: hypothetical protein IAC15_07895 [Candidatus Onthomonas avicola]|nr:hypothetical protein [Candidatus Onthomonas avicola]